MSFSEEIKNEIDIEEEKIEKITAIVNYNVVGFMTCFLTKEDKINQNDIDFISSVSSMISLSIDITMKNNSTNMLVHKLRGAISSINEATKSWSNIPNLNITKIHGEINNTKKKTISKYHFNVKIVSGFSVKKIKLLSSIILSFT